QAGTLAANSQEALGAVPGAGSSSYGLHLYDGATFETQVGSWSTYRQLELVGNLVGTGGVAKVDVTGSNTHQRDGLIYGAGKLDLVGSGTLIVTAANTYTGGTLIENGVLQVSNASGSATGTGAVTVANGGTLKGSATASKGFITGTVGIQSGGTLSALSGETLTLGGLTLGAGSLGTFQLGALTATSMVNITGSNLFIQPSSSTSTLNIVNTGAMGVGTYRLFDYTGTAISDISTLALATSHSGAFNLSLVNNTSNTSIDLSVTAILQQWQKGGSNTNWGNTGNWWTGAVPDGIAAHAQFLNNNGGEAFGTTETVTLDTNKTVGEIVFQNTGTAFTLSAASTQTLTLNESGSSATISVLGTPAANHVISVPLILADNLTVDVTAGSYGLVLSGDISGIDKTLTKTGAGPLTLSGTVANTYSGLTQVTGGSLNLNKTAGVNAIGTGGLLIDSAATVTLLASNQIADGATVTVNGSFDLGTFSETIAILAGGGAVSSGSGSVLTLSSATNATFLGTIGGAGGLAKAGSGTLTLNGSNTYTGGTAINAGTLRVSADHNLGGTGDVTFGGGTLLFSGGFSSARNLTLNSGGGSLNTDGNAVTITGVISGSAALTKTGSGSLTLSGTNTYSGATTLSGGVLSIANNANLGAIATGATLNLNGGGSLQATASIALDNSGANSRNIVVGSGGGTLETLTSGHTLTVSGIISGTGNLTASGAGTLLLTAENTLNGAVTINAG
ncbi:MAG: autotransporter-associated beta strand repeat-containing protein, partial [Verrucomicrobiota bacterium]